MKWNCNCDHCNSINNFSIINMSIVIFITYILTSWFVVINIVRLKYSSNITSTFALIAGFNCGVLERTQSASTGREFAVAAQSKIIAKLL